MAKGFNRSPVRTLRNWDKISKFADENSDSSSNFIEDIVSSMHEVEEEITEPFKGNSSGS